MKGIRYLIGIATLAGLVGCTSTYGKVENLNKQAVPVEEWNCSIKKNFVAAIGVPPDEYRQTCEMYSQEINKLADIFVEKCGSNSEKYDYAYNHAYEYACKLIENKIDQESKLHRRWCLCDDQQ